MVVCYSNVCVCESLFVIKFVCVSYVYMTITENALWVCEVSIKCFLSPLFSMSGLSSVRSSSLIESFCIWTLRSYMRQISCVCTENSWGCFMTHADTILVLTNLYLSWKHVFGLFMPLFIDFFKTMRFCWSGLSCSSDLMLYCKEMIICP